MITSFLINLIWIYLGALVVLVLAKLDIVQINSFTNIVMPFLIFALLAATTLFLSMLGF